MMRWMKLTLAISIVVCAVFGQGANGDDSAFTIRPDVVYGHKAGMALTFDVIKPAHANGAAVLFMVSGGWVSRWISPEVLVRDNPTTPNQFESLVARGYTLFLVRHGSSPYFKVPDAVADVRRAVRYIRLHAEEFGINPERLGVFGGSAGGHLSLMLGTTGDDGNGASDDPLERTSSRVRAVVAIFPPTKIDEFFPLKNRFPALDFEPSRADSVSPLMQVTPDDAPTLLIHGDADTLVPVSNSERIDVEFRKQGVPDKLVVVAGAGHGFRGQDQQLAVEEMLAWFDRYLTSEKKE